MPPRPTYRRKSFWLGLFIIVSLGWASIRSFERLSVLEVRTPDHGRFFIALFNGQAALSRNPFYLGSWDFRIVDQRSADDRFLEDSWRQLPATDNTIVISHGYIILAFLLPWAAFLVWRWRRMRRLGANRRGP